FIADDDARAAGYVFELVMPQDRRAHRLKAALLDLAQRRADLDEVQYHRFAKPAHDFRCAQRVVQQGPTPGAELDEPQIFRRTHLPPDRGDPEPDQLTEHLADLR